MYATATVELPAAAADFCVFFAMIMPTNGTWLYTDRADRSIVDVTGRKMLVTKLVCATCLRREMVAAKHRVAKVALPHALFTALLATLATGDCVGGELSTARTFVKTIQTKGFAAAVALKEAGADLSPT
jgi:hypothetical protein